MKCSTILSNVNPRRVIKYSVELDVMERDKGFAEPRQDPIRRLSSAAASWALQELSNWDFNSSRHRGLSEHSRSCSPTLGQRLGSYTGLWISPFFFVYFHYRSLATQKRPNETPHRFLNGLSSLHFLRTGFLCQGGSPFFSSLYPKELMVIKSINAAFLWLFFFLLVDNHDNWIQTQLHRRFSSLHRPQNVI